MESPKSNHAAVSAEQDREGSEWWTHDLASHIEGGKSFVTTGDDEGQV